MAPFSGPIGTQTFEPGHLVISLNQPSPTDQTVHFQTFDGQLVANVDYVPVSRHVVIPAWQTSVVVEVGLLQPAFSSPGESFYAQISGYTAGGVVDAIATFTMVA